MMSWFLFFTQTDLFDELLSEAEQIHIRRKEAADMLKVILKSLKVFYFYEKVTFANEVQRTYLLSLSIKIRFKRQTVAPTYCRKGVPFTDSFLFWKILVFVHLWFVKKTT